MTEDFLRTQGRNAKRVRLGLLALTLLLSCTGSPPSQYRTHTLSSGEVVKVLSLTRIAFAESDPALMLRYETDQDLSDTAALHAEAGRIWLDFREQAESAGVHGAVLSAIAPPSAGGAGRSRGYNFAYLKRSDGEWYEAGPSPKPR